MIRRGRPGFEPMRNFEFAAPCWMKFDRSTGCRGRSGKRSRCFRGPSRSCRRSWDAPSEEEIAAALEMDAAQFDAFLFQAKGISLLHLEDVGLEEGMSAGLSSRWPTSTRKIRFSACARASRSAGPGDRSPSAERAAGDFALLLRRVDDERDRTGFKGDRIKGLSAPCSGDRPVERGVG